MSQGHGGWFKFGAWLEVRGSVMCFESFKTIWGGDGALAMQFEENLRIPAFSMFWNGAPIEETHWNHGGPHREAGPVNVQYVWQNAKKTIHVRNGSDFEATVKQKNVNNPQCSPEIANMLCSAAVSFRAGGFLYSVQKNGNCKVCFLVQWRGLWVLPAGAGSKWKAKKIILIILINY
jgi:hypothetical protein